MALKPGRNSRVVLSDRAIASLTAFPGGDVYDWLVEQGRIIAHDAVIKAPSRTGHLRRTIRSRVKRANATSTRVQIRCTAEYASYVHNGTGRISVTGRPMTLYAIPRSEQAAVGARDWRYSIGWAKHSVAGQQASPFMRDALETWLMKTDL